MKLENWIDANADGKNWQKVYERGDLASGGDCADVNKSRPNNNLGWPYSGFRWDFARDVTFEILV